MPLVAGLGGRARRDPPLTTVTANPAALGARAFETLAAHMAGEKVPRVTALPVELNVRGSTGPPSVVA